MLNRIKDINYKILLYRRPSKLNISNSKEHIDRLYNNKLLDREGIMHYYRKNIININIGLCGEKYKSKESCSLFKIYDEAQYYQMKYGGVIHTIPYEYMGIVDYSSCLYLYVRKDKQILNTCFNPIKDFIYDMQAYKLYNLYIKLSDIPCYGIKTDCILVRTSKDEL